MNRISRTQRSGRYGSDQSRDESEWRERRDRDQERDHAMRRWGEERRSDRYEGDRRGSRDSPEVGCQISVTCHEITCSYYTGIIYLSGYLTPPHYSTDALLYLSPAEREETAEQRPIRRWLSL